MQRHPHIRPLVAGDIPDLERIIDATGLFPPYMLHGMAAGFLDGSRPDLWFAAVLRDTPVGFGFCEPERMTDGTWNLLAIGVLPEHQARGIGAAMLAYLEAVLSERGARVLIVETLGTPDFAPTRRFYRNNGYVEEARIREFYEAGADKVVFWKHL